MTEGQTKLACPHCGEPLGDGQPHGLHDYKGMKMKLDGYLQPGQSLNRNMLFDAFYASVPKDPEVHVQIYNYEIAPKAFTNWHIHGGPSFYLTLQGRFEGYFEDGRLREGKAGEVYDEPIGKVHRGHNPDPDVPLLGIAIALTAPGVDFVTNVEPPPWAPKA